MKKYVWIWLLCAGCASAWAAETAGVQVEKLTQTQRSWDGSALPAYPEGQPEITVLRITIPPGAVLDWHQHPVINVAYMLRGTLVVEKQSSGERKTIRAGDVLTELVDARHRGINPGDQPVEIVVFYAGREGSALSRP